jgi:Icc-related predicted phosphoesterase
VRIVAFSDLHRDERAGRSLVERSRRVDVVAAVGDLASMHRGLRDMIDVLRAIDRPVLLVPGNNETDEELRAACAGWPAATVLHGQATEIDDVTFFGLGGGVPATPWGWSFDLSEQRAEHMLTALSPGAVLLAHSPPKGHVDGGLGSRGAARDQTPAPPARALRIRARVLGPVQPRGRRAGANLGPGGAVIVLDTGVSRTPRGR